jgi:hypothetical protein
VEMGSCACEERAAHGSTEEAPPVRGELELVSFLVPVFGIEDGRHGFQVGLSRRSRRARRRRRSAGGEGEQKDEEERG